MDGAAEKNTTGEQKEKVRKLKENGREVSGDGGASGEKKARKRREDENMEEMKEEESKSFECVISPLGGSNWQAQDEVYKSGLVQTHRETDRKKSQEERDETSDGDQSLTHRGMDSTRSLKVCCGIWHHDVSSRSFKSYVFWVKCRKSDSSKWRRLSDGVDPSVLPGDWTCKNNTDTAFSSCSAPEEKSSMPEEEMFFYSLVPGSLVWARQSGYT
ncbi:hypothetical protein QTP86_026304, partial [Hemibagrus guttatus]